ncbi:MAG TPA: hypothetical protein VK923_06230 [Euzebyales bacterium]|nr:hypothetical protein [Euzebyales bacterium]
MSAPLVGTAEPGLVRLLITPVRFLPLPQVARFARAAFVLGAAVVGAVSTWLFGTFASEPHFPSIPAWVEHPEPWPITGRKLAGNLVLAGVVGGPVMILVRQSAGPRARHWCGPCSGR